MTGKVLALQFGMNIRSIDLNTEGVTHHDSLLAPQPAGNCINWIAGHILASRNAVHSLLGLAPAWEDGGDRYDRGSRPIAGRPRRYRWTGFWSRSAAPRRL